MDPVTVYRKSHEHPVNRALHMIGIPIIVISLPLAFFDWKIAATLFTGGWILQFIGHAFEGKAPAFLKDPRHLFIAPYWWVRKVFGRETQNHPPDAKH